MLPAALLPNVIWGTFSRSSNHLPHTFVYSILNASILVVSVYTVFGI